MRFTKHITSVQSIFLLILIAFSAQTARAKSVYAIIYHPYDIIGAYKIDGNQIEYQTEIQAPQHGYRAIDLAIDSNSSCIFVTYENSNIIEIMNAKTLEHEGSVTATGASDLAGIVLDEAEQKLYVVDRRSFNLFVYLWNPTTKTLIPYGTNPKTLADLGGDGAYGIALDTTNDHLYVANFTNIIHYYDTNGWSHVNSVNVGEIAVDVDIDSDYLYAGGYYEHDYLLKLNLSTGISEANDIGAGVIGLAVDPNSGLVYTTTYHNQLRVYDTSTSPFTLTDYEDISAGCGVCVPTGDVSYKPPDFLLVKDNNDPNDECVRPWNFIEENYLTFDICWDANNHADSNVVLIDYLPEECYYYSSTPDGNYNSADHTVTWNLANIGDDDANCFELKTKINYWARPGDTLTNLVVMEGDTYLNEATCDVNVCAYGTEIIYVDKDANGYNNGTSWDDAYTDLQDGLTGARNCGAAVTAIWVATGTYKPV